VHPGVRAAVPDLEKAVLAGELTPALAARQILDTFLT
jgi:LAO/AO transport system kinase